MPSSRRNQQRWCTLCQAAVLLVAPAVSGGQALQRRDSAGVEIIAVRVPPRPAPIAVEPKPVVVIGGLRDIPDEELAVGRNPLLLRAGTGVIVADVARLLRMSAAGKLVQRLGRDGAGPGEFGEIHAICHAAGDTLLVIDNRLRRASLFDPTGRFFRAWPLGGNATREPCLGDGKIIVEAKAPVTSAEMGFTAEYAVVDVRTGKATSIGALPVPWSGLFSRPASVVAVRERIYVSDGLRMAYDIRDGTGRLLTRVRTDLLPRPIPPGEAASRLKSMVPPGQGAEVEGRLRAFITRSPAPKVYPMLLRLLVAPGGVVWANEADDAGTSSTWLAFGPNGSLLGRLTLPRPNGAERSSMIGVGDGEITIQYHDRDGAQTMAIYRVHLPVGR